MERLMVGMWHRVYSDFFMPSRLGEYRSFLETAITLGYQVKSILGFWTTVVPSLRDTGEKYLLLRHDVDQHLSTCRKMWAIERELGVVSSYYFRLSTLDPDLMQRIEYFGGEASYHYEEISTVAQKKLLGQRSQVMLEMPYIRSQFAKNLRHLRNLTGLPMKTVASHGDFINRKLGIRNTEILRDQHLRTELGIELEVYDDALLQYVDSRHSDAPYPTFWTPEHPLSVRDAQVLYVLVHPIKWRALPLETFIGNTERLLRGARHRLLAHVD